MEYCEIYNTPISEIILTSDGESLTGLYFKNQKYLPDIYESVTKSLPVFNQTKKWLDIYFAGECPNFTPPIQFENASPFRKRVWEILLTIPYGEVTTYGNIAKQIEREIGKRVSAQAVGGAVGHNPIGIIVPCHRVIGANKSLTGYAGGLDKKVELLTIEKVAKNKYKL